MRITCRSATITAISAVAVLGLGGGALASTSASAAAKPVYMHGCEGGKQGRTFYDMYSANTKEPKSCPKGAWPVSWPTSAGQGPAGPAGKDADSLAGEAVQPTTQDQLQYIGGTILQNSGGHGATGVTSLELQPGTYLIDASLKFDRSVSATASDPDTYGYLALYTGSTNETSFTSFSQAAGTATTGALPKLVNGSEVIDQVADYTGILVVKTAEWVNLAGFAYNSDESGAAYSGNLTQPGSVVVSDGSLAAVKIAS